MGKEVLAIIPARGGSFGIPRKNLEKINGKSLVAHSVQHALDAKLVTRVIVSTEDAEIAEEARKAGAETPFTRPEELAGGEVLDWPVFQHALDVLKETEGYQPDIIVHLRPTAPYRKAAWIDEAISLLTDNPDASSVRSVSPPRDHPYRVFTLDDKGYLNALMAHEHPEPFLLRRQDFPEMYHYNCVIDITRPETIAEGSMTGDKMLPFLMESDAVIDIDSPRDLAIARLIMENGV